MENNYKGIIIEESLEDTSVLKDVVVLNTKVEVVTRTHKTPWIKQWTLHTVEIPEGNAAAVAERISKSLDSKHAWYADFKNGSYHYIVFRNKVFKLDRNNKKQYDEAKQYGLSIGIPEYQLMNYEGLPIDVLAQFLREASEHGYANKNAAKAASSRLGSFDYHFEKDDLMYHDTYFGSRDFIGEEIVYQEQKPVWGANYFGFILKSEVGEKELYDFLRQALAQEGDPLFPVRGPKSFAAGNWGYGFSASGDLANFSGHEEISLKGVVVYRCFVHGGFIQ